MSGSNTSGTITDGSFFSSSPAFLSLGPISLTVGQSISQVYLGDASSPLAVGVFPVVSAVTATPDNDQPNDSAWGGSSDDQMHGMGGNDTLLGNGGNDVLYGELGPVDYGSLVQISIGGISGTPAGADLLDGGAGNDSAFGQDGDDSLIGGTGNDYLDGGNGQDLADYSSSTGGVEVDLATARVADGLGGTDTITSVERFNLSAQDDTVIGGTGDHVFAGGDGNDLLDYSDAPNPVELDLAAGTAVNGYGGTDNFTGFERFVLGSGNDLVVSGAGNQDIDLGGGDDSIVWMDGDGADTIRLGDGNDTLDLQGWNEGPDNPWDTVAGTEAGSTIFNNGSSALTVFGFDSENDTIACFARGTLIATDRGEVPVEDLRTGDLVLTLHRGARLMPLVWVGRSHINVRRHRDRRSIAPVVIRAGAIMPGMPRRDLRVSPDHAIHIDGRLIPARHLVNGTSIVQEAYCDEVTYFHLEIEGHGLLVSEGAVTESYLDDGNRHLFDNFGFVAIAGGFDAARDAGRYAELACAPILTDGLELEQIRARLAGPNEEHVAA